MEFILSHLIDFIDQYYHQKRILKKLKKLKLEIIFDIGAHKGEFSKSILNIKTTKKIYAFEASHINFLQLKKKLKSIISRVEIFLINNGVSEKEGFKNIKQTDESSSSTYSDINEFSKYFKKKKFFFYGKKKYFTNYETKLITLNNFFYQNKLK